MGKKGKKKHFKLMHWLIIAVTSLLIIGMLATVFKRPIIYYSKKVYHKIKPKAEIKEVEARNTKTNLITEIKIPKGEVYGIDISRHQGNINWSILKEFTFKYHKISFIYIKATESDDWIDKNFSSNWKKSKEHGFIRGAYHFFDPKAEANVQMENFFNNVELEKGDLPPVLDVEQESRISVSEYQKRVLLCLQLMEKHYGVKPILYVNKVFYNTYFDTEKFKKYLIWMSRLQKTPPKQDNWIFWQFTHSSVIPGIDEYVDFNVFNGSTNEFKILQQQ